MLSMYVKYWFTAQSETSVPRNDLNLIKELKQYKNVVDAEIKSLYGYFWSLSQH